MDDSPESLTKFDQGLTKIELDELYRMHYFFFQKYSPLGEKIPENCLKNRKKPENFSKSSDDSSEG